ncbi:MAG TPA: carboxymuconolactone decarboxylase family protein [Stellaceae bacterium]|nr:carboxymuconolactone decarboxylase family protein [Stellaceae bacterium]
MSRVAELADEQMSPDQKRIRDEIAGPRGGHARGPFAIWLRHPALADAANRLGNVLRQKSRLEPRAFELMVLVIARHWSAQYEWHVHEAAARAAGLPNDVIEAIRAKKRPALEREQEKIVYDAITELNESRALAPATYERALAAFGLEVLIELIAGAGFYTMVAMTLDAFEAPVPGGGRPLP